MNEQKNVPKSTRAQRIIAAILTVAFLATLAVFGIYGLVTRPRTLVNSLKYHRAKNYLADPDDTSFFSMMSARIASLQNALGKALPLEDELGVVNASFQFALGKSLTVQGSEQMIRLDNGQLYYLTQRKSLAPKAEEIVRLYQSLSGEIPFLFSYVHPGFFNGGTQLPAGYDAIDTSDELADEVLSIIRGAGIEALDSRTFFEGTGLTNDELELKTDKHWTSRAALLAAPIYAKKINALTGANLDVDRLQIDQFDAEFHPQMFLGDFGHQIGRINSVLDDITLFLPKYPTDITRHSEHRTGDIEDVTGPFDQSVLRRERMELDEGDVSTTAYTAYGLIEAFETLTNNGDCEDITILVLRDSYSEPICSFLSLAARHVISADLRYCDRSAVELIDEYQPDIVVVSFSRLLLDTNDYDLGVDAI